MKIGSSTPTADLTRHVIRATSRTARPHAKIFGVPSGTYTKDSPERSVGKTCDLAFGYMGGLNAWRKFEPDKFTDAEVETFKARMARGASRDQSSSGTTSIVPPCLRCASAARSSAAAAST